MEKNNLTLIGIAAICALLLSLPLAWLTVHQATVTTTSPDMHNFDFQNPQSFHQTTTHTRTVNQSMDISGINGTVSLGGASIPLWLVIVLAIIAVAIALINALQITSIPKVIMILTLVFTGCVVLFLMFIALSSPEASLGIAPFIALIGMGLGLYIAWMKPISA